MNTLDERITALKPGEAMRLGGTEECWTTAERSGDGRTIRFTRHTPAGFRVFRTASR